MGILEKQLLPQAFVYGWPDLKEHIGIGVYAIPVFTSEAVAQRQIGQFQATRMTCPPSLVQG